MKKTKVYAKILFIALFLPIAASYLISVVQRIMIDTSGSYVELPALRVSNALALGVTVALSVAAIIVGRKMEQGVFYYAIGIFVATIGLLFPVAESELFVTRNLLAMLMVGGYMVGVIWNVVWKWRR